MLNHRVGCRVSVSQEDQFQRNGVILDQRSGVWNDDTSAVSRGGGSGFTAIFEIVAADKARGRRVKKETPLRALPHPWHPCCPDLPRHPAGARGERAREPWSTTRSSLTIPNLIPPERIGVPTANSIGLFWIPLRPFATLGTPWPP
jgi:hypothetical protein